jgi:GTP cyclohydrolase II
MAKSATCRELVGEEVTPFAEALLPTHRGDFRIFVFRQPETALEHVAMTRGEVQGRDGLLVRVHSECLTSEVFGSLRCDCRDQLDWSMDEIANAEAGVLIYLRQEGRGIGLGNKVRAYALQSEGLDTFEAILKHLGVGSVDLMTNNPRKVDELRENGIVIRNRIPVPTPVTPQNESYLRAKKRRSGHLIDL